jgi:xylulokinase
VRPGGCIVKLGTAGNVNVVTAEPRPDRRTLTYCHVLPGRWYTIAATNAGAAAANWFREAFDPQDQMAGPEGQFVVDRLAAGAAPGSEGLLFHPFLQGERCPYWDPNLRGSFFGITTRHRLAHFARAVLEGVAFSLRDCKALLRELGMTPDHVRLMGGGARSTLWRQIVADVLDLELEVCEREATSFGAALLAGVSDGLLDFEAAAAQARTQTSEMVRPDPAAAARYARLYELYRDVVQALAPIYGRLSEATT